ncbi:hypothetical protein CLIB1444_06S06656 [[Candida] jaroonii]|uniref:Uncharacterized protein n=1 Tax=[Candida] jaroonii TaxID=467808 RepID=A0ACA9YB32_9ASCO|nr:hypothetical protein CLIB1444_06S06656 [[Candida] jaroonii]
MEGKFDPQYVDFFHQHLATNEKILATHRVPLNVTRSGGNVIPGQSPPREMARIFDISFGRKYSTGPDIGARVFVPKGDAPEGGFPLFIWFHGGGWTLGGLDTENSYCTHAAETGHCVVMTVDYRLAPEDPFPACVDDSFDAVAWAFAQGPQELGINNSKIAIGGSSAGGNLTAIVTHKFAASELAAQYPPVVFQVLVVPVTDNTATAATQPSWGENEFTTQLPAEKMLWYRALYLPNPDDCGHPESSPLFYPDESFAKVPPCFIAAAERDVLRSEAEAYGEKLKKNGVDTTVMIYRGMPHTAMVMDDVLDEGKRLVAETTRALYKAFYGVQ